MKRYFSNLFTIIPTYNVDSIDGDTINISTGNSADTILTRSDLEFSETQKESGANDYYNQQCSPVSHSVDATIRSKYRKEKVIVQLQTTQGEIFTWGSIEVPVRVTLNSELNADKWTFKRLSITPIIE